MSLVNDGETPSPEAASRPFSPFRNSAFLRFWLMRSCSSSTSQILTVAIGWEVYALSHDPLDLGLVGLAQFIPAVLLALPAGHAIDRYPRRTILRLAMSVNVVIGASLTAAALFGFLSLNLIFALAALQGVARAFEQPASQVFVSGIVPRQHLGQAVTWSSSIFQAATIIGPSIGGILFGFGPALTYGVCAVGYFGALMLAFLLPPATQTLSREKATVASVLAGLSFVFSNKPLLGSISLDLFAVLLGGATALLPVYARDILNIGPFGLGVLRGAPAVGALLVAAFLARWPIKHKNGLAMLGGVFLFGIGTCVFAVSKDAYLSFVALAVLGASDMVSVFVRLSLVQLRTPDEMRGRVSAVNSIFIGTSNQLGEFESGVTARLLGTVPATLLGGIGTLVVVAAWAILFPSLRRIDRLDEAPAN